MPNGNTGIPLIVLLAAAPSPAQFVNTAAWLGSEQEEVRRNFRQGTEYFLDRLSYVVTPPWWERGLPRFDDRLDYRVGSISATQFTIESALDLARELGDGFTVRYHMLQGENRDTRFLRHALDLDCALGEETALFAQVEPFADKSAIDVSLGAWLWRRDHQAVRVMATAVDWRNEKDSRIDYERDPYALLVAGVFGEPDAMRISFELASQMPFAVRQLDDGERLELQRHLASARCHLPLAASDWLVLAAETESTAKALQPGTTGASPEDFTRWFHQLRVEWWRDVTIPWSAGFVHTWHDEDGIRSAAPAEDLRTRRREWLALARLQLPVQSRLSFEPQLLAGYVRDEFVDGTDARSRERFEGKLAWNTRWDFSAAATLALVVSVQLDEPAFGGGGVQFVARF